MATCRKWSPVHECTFSFVPNAVNYAMESEVLHAKYCNITVCFVCQSEMLIQSMLFRNSFRRYKYK